MPQETELAFQEREGEERKKSERKAKRRKIETKRDKEVLHVPSLGINLHLVYEHQF